MDTKTLNEVQKTQLDEIVSKMTTNGENPANIQFVVNDFKNKYGTPVASNDLASSINTGTENVVRDIVGTQQSQSQGFLPSLIRTTVGSQGLAGVAQLPGRVAAEPGLISDTTSGFQRVADLANQAGNAQAQANKTSDPVEKAKLIKFAAETLATARDLDSSMKGLASDIITPGQAIGTTVNAALTATTGARPNLLGSVPGLEALQTIPKTASFINSWAKALYYGGRVAENAGLGAAFQAGNNLVNQKPIGQNVGTAALIGGALPIAGLAASKAKDAILGQTTPLAEQVINSLIKPLQKDFAYGKNPAQGILNEGIVANNLPDLSQKVSAKISEVGSRIGQIGQTLDQNTKLSLDLTPALTPIDQAIDKAAKLNNPTLFNSLNNVKVALVHELGTGIDEKGLPSIVQKSPRNLIAATYGEAKDFLTNIAEHTRFTGNPSDDKALNSATKQAYGIARDIMNKGADSVSPAVGTEVRNLNERYGDLLSAKSAINHRDIVLKRQNFLNLADKFSIPVAVASSAATALITGDFAKAGIVLASELGTIVGGKILGSTAAKTRVAQFISRLAPEERQGILNSTPILKNLYERLTGQGATENPSEILPTTQTQKGAATLGTLSAGAGLTGAAVLAAQPKKIIYSSNGTVGQATQKANSNPVSALTVKGATPFETIKDEVVKRETRGTVEPYATTTVNKSDGSTDYGKYQVNDKLIQTFFEPMMGKPFDKQSFLSSPQEQDEFFTKIYNHAVQDLGVRSLDTFLLLYHLNGFSNISKGEIEKLRNSPEGKRYLAIK